MGIFYFILIDGSYSLQIFPTPSPCTQIQQNLTVGWKGARVSFNFNDEWMIISCTWALVLLNIQNSNNSYSIAWSHIASSSVNNRSLDNKADAVETSILRTSPCFHSERSLLHWTFIQNIAFFAKHFSTYPKVRQQVDLQHLLQILRRSFPDGHQRQYAGIVHQNVHLPEAALDTLSQLLNRFIAGNVRLKAQIVKESYDSVITMFSSTAISTWLEAKLVGKWQLSIA